MNTITGEYGITRSSILPATSAQSSAAAKTNDTINTVNPDILNDGPGEVGTLRVGGVIVVFESIDGAVPVGVYDCDATVELVELPLDGTSPARAPKYDCFRVTLSSNSVPSPVPGNVEGIQEYCLC